MSSRTRKILELAKSLEGDEAFSTEKIVKSTTEDNAFESDIEHHAGCFVVNEDGTLIPYADVPDLNLDLVNIGNFSFPSHVSEAEALTAVEELTCNLQNTDNLDNSNSLEEPSSSTSPNFKNALVKTSSDAVLAVDNVHIMVVVAEVYSEPNPLPDPKFLLTNKQDKNNLLIVDNNLIENEIEVYETIENNTDNAIETFEPNIGNKGQNVLEDSKTVELINQLSNRKRRKRYQVNEDDWQCKQAKLLREQGKEYKGRRISDGKVTGYASRPERSMKPIECKCNGKTFQCHKLSESERKRIFENFWTLTFSFIALVLSCFLTKNLKKFF